MIRRVVLLGARIVLGATVSFVLASCARNSQEDSTPVQTGGLDRTVLPIAEPPVASITEKDARKVTPPARFDVKAPENAPNVVIVLLDDIGFGATSTFGGPISMPTFDRLASGGLRYNRFHTTALCSPTRTALLTGRNHHINNAGAIMELATAFPGNTGVRPNSVAPLAKILRHNGYSTAAFGKYHETAPWEATVSGPYDRWPTGSGFDKFYGFLGGETNQWSPALIDGVARVEVPDDPDYHLTTDLANQAVAWIGFQQAMTPDKPFYVYFATGATHAPHHVSKEWIAKYKGRFDQGWDALRDETFARQLEMGIVPANTKLTPRPAEIPAWDSLGEDEKRLYRRQMETFAGFAEHTDHEVGRLVQALEDMGELDNTIFFYIAGDNGSSAEGGPAGSYNEILALNGIVSDVSSQMEHIDEWGGPSTFPHFAVGWAHATNTPFQWTKQVASHFGGTRNGMVIHWPARIQNTHGEIRAQFHHVIDIAPTVLEAAGLPEPTMVEGVKQYPMDGVSMVYTFDDAAATERRTTQYFEMFGNRAIYQNGWVACTRHSIPWLMVENPPFDQDVWELYNIAEDFSQANDLASTNPEKLNELKAVFDQEAIKNHVYPMDDRRSERFDAAVAGRPDIMGTRTSLTVYEGMTGMHEYGFINTKGRSFMVTAEVDVPRGGANGVILAQSGRFGGWSLYMKNGRVHGVYNFGGLEQTKASAAQALSPGTHTVVYDFVYDGGKPGSAGTIKLSVDGQPAGEARVPRTMPFLYGEAADVGADHETPVSEDYTSRNSDFTGHIIKVTVEQK
ncbi:MAG TPA: sulfatase-like hydrolase/transferase [Candidatus Krumholzibacteria bacterium]|nr:sulfatase-like hydrolase/transferase [Candidatus Krumholzibacteria bacterium]